MIPLVRKTRKQGGAGLSPAGELGLWIEITLARVSGAVCQVTGIGVIVFGVSSLYVLVPRSGGTSSAAVPYGSESCQLSSHCWPQLVQPVPFTLCSAQLTAPSPRLQPSPTQGAAPAALCWSDTPDELYASCSGGVSPPGPAGTS